MVLRVHNMSNGSLTRRGVLCLLSSSAFLSCLPEIGNARTVTVSTPDELAQAVRHASGGEVLRLAPGDYGRFNIKSSLARGKLFPRPVTLVSADPARPAHFTGLRLRGVQNMILDGLVFDYRFRPGEKQHVRLAHISGCKNITLRQCLFDGDLARETGTGQDGFPTGYAVVVDKSHSFRLESCTIRKFMRGAVLSDGSNYAVINSDLSLLRSDGINVKEVAGIRIEGNYLHDFLRAYQLKDHADMIQFFSTGAAAPTRDVVIRANVLRSGAGGATQSIFMRNELVDKGLAGREMFYQNVTIEDNVIINGHLHGITLGETAHAVIRRNTLLRNQIHVTNERRHKKVWIPRVQIAEASVDVRVVNNIALGLPMGRERWGGQSYDGNLSLQDMTPTQPGYYHKALVAPMTADPLKLASYVVAAGGIANRHNLGAPLLRPGADRSRYDGGKLQ